MMKYIRLDYAGFIVFDKSQKHSDMAKKFPHDTVLSAGFVESWSEEFSISCQGESESLHIKSDENDSAMLTRRLSAYSY
jgi:hypothetical protein